MLPLYRDLNHFLREKFGEKVCKICVDAGFSCPNRDGHIGRGGCLFCGEKGGGDFIPAPDAPIPEQIRRGAILAGRRGVRRFVAYFQSFSNTYAPIPVLAAKYRDALQDPRICALAVATRPDCIDEAVADLLASFAPRCYVWVELGLQTASEHTARQMHMGYTERDFERAVRTLACRGIDTVAHIMVGLPGQSHEEDLHTLALVNALPVTGIKIHATYVCRDSGLAKLYLSGRYTPLTLHRYVDAVVDLLCHARPDLVIHRLTGDPPRHSLLAPDFVRNKITVLNLIRKTMLDAGLVQGCRRKDSP